MPKAPKTLGTVLKMGTITYPNWFEIQTDWDSSLWSIIPTPIVLKLGSVIDSAEALSHGVDGRTVGSFVEPHERIRLNWMTWLDNPVFRLNLYKYLIILNQIEPVTRLLQKLK